MQTGFASRALGPGTRPLLVHRVEVIVMPIRSIDLGPAATLPGPSRRVTVEPIQVPTRAPAPVPPARPLPAPDRGRPPERRPVPSR